jgi:disulfide bond formation protein DsbB
MNWLKRNALYLAWIVALLAAFGSLYFQYVAGFPPCILCWYQRIAMYPLVLIIPIGIIKKDPVLPIYALTLSVIGSAIAIFHNLLYYNLIPESAAPCLQGISCTTKFIEWFGFLTIPLLSLISFAVIIALAIIARRSDQYEQRN